MCDTIIAPIGSTRDGVVLFGKNSDRERNEAQAVECLPRSCHATDAALACTYITIPQIECTNAVVLCRPFWTWGAEMGVNEYGVVIGNVGLHARSPAPRENALIGMDLVRLGLERASSASEAVQVITSLLERYGQGGNCGHLASAYYNNGFLISDARDAFVVETIGREWMVERVRGVRAMSNRYTIGCDVERVSTGMFAHLQQLGLSSEPAPNYAEVVADPNREHIGNAAARRSCSTSLLSLRDGKLSVSDMMCILRDHGSGERYHPEWKSECLARRTLCMHAGAEECAGQTVGSMVAQLTATQAVLWVTATAAPCISIFKPLLVNAPAPFSRQRPTGQFDQTSLWWRHERLYRRSLLGDFAAFLESIRTERDALEHDFQLRMEGVLNGGSATECAQVVSACWRDAIELEEGWYARATRPARNHQKKSSHTDGGT